MQRPDLRLSRSRMPFEDAERSQRFIAQKVIPELRQWDVEAKAA